MLAAPGPPSLSVQGKLPLSWNLKSPQVAVLGLWECWTFSPGALLLGLRAGPHPGTGMGGMSASPPPAVFWQKLTGL